MKRFVSKIKNSQRIRVLITDVNNVTIFGIYTTVKEVFNGECFVLSNHQESTIKALNEIGSLRKNGECVGLVCGTDFGNQIQVDLV